MKLIDTHAHISYKDYSGKIEDIIHAAQDNGVDKIISIGTDLKSSEECIKLSEKYSCLYATCGIHPHEAEKAPKRYLYELEELSCNSKVVAFGEIGLDYYYNFSDRKIQKKIYQEQLEMAKSLQFPAIVHCRESDDDILNGIRESDHSTGVIHCFASNVKFANDILDTGFHISFTGMITFVQKLEQVVVEIPLEKIMLETEKIVRLAQINRFTISITKSI